MATISVNTNIAEVNDRIRSRLDKLKDKDYLLRPVCFDLIELMKLRIHERGENASGKQIGTYSNSYLKYRQAKHSRSSDTKIIISLTRQLENDWSVIATQKGYGIGFKNPFNLQKAIWVQGGHAASTVKKHKRVIGGKNIEVESHNRKAWPGYGTIFSMTVQENKYALDLLNQLVKDALET